MTTVEHCPLSPAGASIPPETMMHFLPVSDFPPYFRKIFGLSENFLQFYLYPKHFLTFIRQNFWWLFCHRPQISNFLPIFAVSIYFPPVSRKLFFRPLLLHIPLCFRQIRLLFTYFTCILFPPYFDHAWCIYASPNARTGRLCPIEWFTVIKT